MFSLVTFPNENDSDFFNQSRSECVERVSQYDWGLPFWRAILVSCGLETKEYSIIENMIELVRNGSTAFMNPVSISHKLDFTSTLANGDTSTKFQQTTGNVH